LEHRQRGSNDKRLAVGKFKTARFAPEKRAEDRRASHGSDC